MELVILWLAGAIGAAVWANNKGRSAFGYFLLSIILSPLIGLLFAGIASDKTRLEDEPTAETHDRCPDCRELIRRDAKKCKHCGSTLTASVIDTPPETDDKIGVRSSGSTSSSNGILVAVLIIITLAVLTKACVNP